jgi:hypothetical protein
MRILWNLGNSLTILIQYFNLETMAFKLFGNYLRNGKAFEHKTAFGQRLINSIYPEHLGLHSARTSKAKKSSTKHGTNFLIINYPRRPAFGSPLSGWPICPRFQVGNLAGFMNGELENGSEIFKGGVEQG